MNWKPITEQELKEKLRLDVEMLPESEVKLFRKFSVPAHRVPCKRIAASGDEEVFVVARFGDFVIVFDDVEDEYGIGTIREGMPLTEWNLYGTLKSTLVELKDRSIRGRTEKQSGAAH